MWWKGSIHMYIPTGQCYLRISDGFVKIQKCVWTQAYCGHNWIVQWSVFMRLCAVQRGREMKLAKVLSGRLYGARWYLPSPLSPVRVCTHWQAHGWEPCRRKHQERRPYFHRLPTTAHERDTIWGWYTCTSTYWRLTCGSCSATIPWAC